MNHRIDFREESRCGNLLHTKSLEVPSTFDDDGNESTSNLSDLLDELLSPSYVPDDPISDELNINEDRRIRLLCTKSRRDSSSSRHHTGPKSRNSREEKVGLGNEIKRRNEKSRRDSSKKKDSVEVENEDLRKKWRAKSREMKERSKRDLHRQSPTRGGEAKEDWNMDDHSNNQASFLEWLVAEQKRRDETDTVVTPKLNNTSNRNLMADLESSDLSVILRSLSPLEKSPTCSKSLEAYLLAIQDDKRTRQTEVRGKAEIKSTISDLSGLTDAFPGHQCPLYLRDTFPNHLLPPTLFSAEEGNEQESQSGWKHKCGCTDPKIGDPKVTASTNRTVKRVTFGNVHVRYYECILGDNPWCLSGPSLGIGWMHSLEEIFPIDEYDQKPKRFNDELIILRSEREERLLSLGYTDKEIADAVRSVKKCKNQRRQTIQNLGAQPFEEALQSAGRKVKRLIVSVNRSKKLIT